MTDFQQNDDIQAALISEIAGLQARIEELEAQLTARERQQNLSIRSIFHDIKNPLAITLGSLQVAKLIVGNSLSPKVLRLLNSAEDGGKAQLAMINNLADQIKIEMGELTILQEPFQPGTIVQKCFDQSAKIDTIKTFSFSDNAPAISISGDSQIFHRSVENIIDNCIRHTRKDCRIIGETDSSIPDSRWTLTISDNGEQIAEDQLEAIFDRRKLTLAKNLGGRRDIGMGLAFARTAARALGGDLQAVKNHDSGATFILSLPCNPSFAQTRG